jgi:hypothetical protein
MKAPVGIKLYWFNVRTGMMEMARTAGEVSVAGVRYLRMSAQSCRTAPIHAHDNEWGYARIDQIDRPGGLLFSSLPAAALGYRAICETKLRANEGEATALSQRIAYFNDLLAGMAA